ncbi:MAG: penicillin-binding protein 2 [Gammaproteobacteria bacterium]|nr:penicillin-binding protein 2 [Gammaproteobacteria bacterium]
MARARIKDEWVEVRLFTTRTIMAMIGVLLLIGLIVSRLYFLQVTRQSHFATLSDDNRVRIQTIAPNRGLIFDRNGLLLAENVPSYQLEIVPEQVGDLDDLLGRLRILLDISDEELERFDKLRRTKRSFQPIPLLYNLSENEVSLFAVNRQDFPGAEIQARLTRRYPQGDVLAHALGYIGNITESELAERDPARYSGTSQIGKVGLERAYEDLLHGYPGIRQVETNAQGRVLRVLETEPPQPGNDLYLSIDWKLQETAFNALGDQRGAIVAVDPRTGEVLAMVSKPSYDPNLFVDGIDRKSYAALIDNYDRPLLNRAVVGTYPPGSTLKPMIGLAGLYYGVVASTHKTLCKGIWRLEGNPRPYRDWKREGHGVVDLDAAITESCDVYFYELSVELGIDRINEFLSWFGLGRATGIDLVGEADGLLPSREWKRRARRMPWFPGDTVNIGIGQGFMLTTPLQLAHATSILATRGEAHAPRLVRETIDPASGEVTSQLAPAEPAVDVRNEWAWEHVIKSMEHVTQPPRGTARGPYFGAPYDTAGKTGTAQVYTLAEDEEYDAEEVAERLRDHGLFIAFAPAMEPTIALAVMVENGGGASSATPVARKILDEWLLRPDPPEYTP